MKYRLSSSLILLAVIACMHPGLLGAESLSPAALAGKEAYQTCHACHNPALDPPLAPPMFGVQRRYGMAYPDKQEFIRRVAAFVKQPAMDKAIMRRPVQKLGLMPAIDLPEEQITNIATYIYEESFSLPCKHWEIAVKNAEAKGEVDGHIQKDRMKLQRFCNK